MSRRNEGPSPYQGILVVNKPTGWTSFDVLAKLRGVLGTRGLGHSGTLDPMATGVLPVFVGMARKAVDMQENHDKTYLATMRLGMATDTGDITGTVTRTYEESLTAFEPTDGDALVVTDTATLEALEQAGGSYTILRDYGDVFWDIRMNINDVTNNFANPFTLPEAPQRGAGRK